MLKTALQDDLMTHPSRMTFSKSYAHLGIMGGPAPEPPCSLQAELGFSVNGCWRASQANRELELRANALVLTLISPDFAAEIHTWVLSLDSVSRGDLCSVEFPKETLPTSFMPRPDSIGLYEQQPEAMSDLIIQGTRRLDLLAARAQFLFTLGRHIWSTTHRHHPRPGDFGGAIASLGTSLCRGKIAEHLPIPCFTTTI